MDGRIIHILEQGYVIISQEQQEIGKRTAEFQRDSQREIVQQGSSARSSFVQSDITPDFALELSAKYTELEAAVENLEQDVRDVAVSPKEIIEFYSKIGALCESIGLAQRYVYQRQMALMLGTADSMAFCANGEVLDEREIAILRNASEQHEQEVKHNDEVIAKFGVLRNRLIEVQIQAAKRHGDKSIFEVLQLDAGRVRPPPSRQDVYQLEEHVDRLEKEVETLEKSANFVPAEADKLGTEINCFSTGVQGAIDQAEDEEKSCELETLQGRLRVVLGKARALASQDHADTEQDTDEEKRTDAGAPRGSSFLQLQLKTVQTPEDAKGQSNEYGVPKGANQLGLQAEQRRDAVIIRAAIIAENLKNSRLTAFVQSQLSSFSQPHEHQSGSRPAKRQRTGEPAPDPILFVAQKRQKKVHFVMDSSTADEEKPNVGNRGCVSFLQLKSDGDQVARSADVPLEDLEAQKQNTLAAKGEAEDADKTLVEAAKAMTKAVKAKAKEIIEIQDEIQDNDVHQRAYNKNLAKRLAHQRQSRNAAKDKMHQTFLDKIEEVSQNQSAAHKKQSKQRQQRYRRDKQLKLALKAKQKKQREEEEEKKRLERQTRERIEAGWQKLQANKREKAREELHRAEQEKDRLQYELAQVREETRRLAVELAQAVERQERQLAAQEQPRVEQERERPPADVNRGVSFLQISIRGDGDDDHDDHKAFTAKSLPGQHLTDADKHWHIAVCYLSLVILTLQIHSLIQHLSHPGAIRERYDEVCDSGTGFVELQAHHPTPPHPLTEEIAPQNVPAFFKAPFKSKPPAARVPEDHKKWEREIHALNEKLREEFHVYQPRSDARRVAD